MTTLQGNCPTSREERDIDQLQQILNLEEEEKIIY